MGNEGALDEAGGAEGKLRETGIQGSNLGKKTETITNDIGGFINLDQRSLYLLCHAVRRGYSDPIRAVQRTLGINDEELYTPKDAATRSLGDIWQSYIDQLWTQ